MRETTRDAAGFWTRVLGYERADYRVTRVERVTPRAIGGSGATYDVRVERAMTSRTYDVYATSDADACMLAIVCAVADQF